MRQNLLEFYRVQQKALLLVISFIKIIYEKDKILSFMTI